LPASEAVKKSEKYKEKLARKVKESEAKSRGIFLVFPVS
jgi:hypothetical protein